MPSSEPRSRSASGEQALVSGEHPSVLMVDDVPANLVALEALLDDMKCQLVSARSGNEALRRLLKQQFAVVLLDAHMPEMDGYEVARHIRQNPSTREIPIIFLTASNNTEENVLRGYGSGAVDFLFKPLNPHILRSKVQIFLELDRSRRLLASANLRLEAKNDELHRAIDAKTVLAESFRQTNERLETAYAELQRTQTQLVQSAKMASLGELVAGVAHEINNPLSFSMSHLKTIQKVLAELQAEPAAVPSFTAPRWERARSRLGEMSVGLERIRDLVVKLRTFSRLDEGERKVVNMRECVESVLTILSHRTKDRIEISLQFGEPELLECYPSLLNQALMNLVSNSIDAIEDFGSVSISSGAENSEYVIRVSDTGSGIPPEIRDRILEPFFTTKPVGLGTGLGLSITYSILKKHGGALHFDERPGGGTIATVRLPLAA